MKKILNVPIILVFAFAISALFTACKEIDDGNRNDITPITITTTSSNVKLEINLKSYNNSTFHSGQTIDWGDGSTPEPISESSKDYEYWHTYTSGGTHTITIMSEMYILAIRDITLIALDISKTTTLGALFLYNIDCETLDVKYDNDKLNLGYGFNMWCDDSRITNLDLRKCTPLHNLCIQCSQITTLNASKSTSLRKLEFAVNRITTLDVSQCATLEQISGGYNQFITLNASKCAALQLVNCYNYSDTIPHSQTLNVSDCPALTRISYTGFNITTLNVSNCPALISLECQSNQLTKLDVSSCTALKTLYCGNNNFSSFALNTLFGTLHSNNIPDKTINIYKNPGTDGCDISIAENKGWTVKK